MPITEKFVCKAIKYSDWVVFGLVCLFCSLVKRLEFGPAPPRAVSQGPQSPQGGVKILLWEEKEGAPTLHLQWPGTIPPSLLPPTTMGFWTELTSLVAAQLFEQKPLSLLSTLSAYRLLLCEASIAQQFYYRKQLVYQKTNKRGTHCLCCIFYCIFDTVVGSIEKQALCVLFLL